jgi:hypothetical protein
VVQLPYTATNQPHRLRVALVDEDDKPSALFHAEGTEAPPPLGVTVPFNVGRPANIGVGDEQSFTVGTNMIGLPLANPASTSSSSTSMSFRGVETREIGRSFEFC